MSDSVSLAAEQDRRRHANRYSRTNTPLKDDNDKDSRAAEEAFCDFVGLPHSVIPKKKHAGFQFTINGVTVKVYAAPRDKNLLVPTRKRMVWADVYVLAWVERFGEERSAAIVRWCNRSTVETVIPAIHKIDGPYKLESRLLPYTRMSGDLHALRQRLGLAHRQESLL